MDHKQKSVINVIRFINELLHKSLKCDRIGHKPQLRWERGVRKDTNTSWGVAIKFRRERDQCKRCNFGLTEWKETYTKVLTGLTMSSLSWEIFNETGTDIWTWGWA